MPQSIKHTIQGLSTQTQPRSAQRSLVKVESGINGLLPTSWAPPIYSVSLSTKLRCALAGHCFLLLTAVRSFSLASAKRKNKSRSEKTIGALTTSASRASPDPFNDGGMHDGSALYQLAEETRRLVGAAVSMQPGYHTQVLHIGGNRRAYLPALCGEESAPAYIVTGRKLGADLCIVFDE